MANTLDSNLTTDHRILERALTVLQHRLAPLSGFSRNFSTDPLKPKATVQVEVVTAGGTAQTNATDFEDTTNFVVTTEAVPVTVNRITTGFHINADERDGGHRLDDQTEIKLAEFSDAIWDKVAALLIEGNFANPHIAAPAAFGRDDLASLWEFVAKGRAKTVVLDAGYYQRFIPGTIQDFNPLSGGIMPGWDGFHLATKWDAAGTNIRGFACSPSAIAVASGLPLISPSADRVSRWTPLTLPDLGLSIVYQRWFSNKTKTDWVNLETMFGAAKAMDNALKLIKSQ